VNDGDYCLEKKSAVSHILQFGDTASSVGDVDVSAGMRISKGDDA